MGPVFLGKQDKWDNVIDATIQLVHMLTFSIRTLFANVSLSKSNTKRDLAICQSNSRIYKTHYRSFLHCENRQIMHTFKLANYF